jgi:hypothetical protein
VRLFFSAAAVVDKTKDMPMVEMSSGGDRVGWLGWAVCLLKGEPFFTLSELMIIVHR